MTKIFSSFKRILALLIVFGLVTGLVPVTALEGFGAVVASAAEPAEKFELNNGYVKVTVSEKNGGFGIRTVEGDKVNKSDNDQYLVYEYDEDNTSFTSFQVTRNGKTKEYIFGGKYFENLGNSDVTVTQADGQIIAKWSVDSLTFTQTINLVTTGSNEHGTAQISYGVENSGEPAEVKVRILMDTALGYQDYAFYKVGSNYVETETALAQDGYEKSFYAVTNQNDPRIVAYTINAAVDERECKPYQTIFAHWNNLASTVFEYTADETMNFTNFNNRQYLTSDSAFALYFDMGQVEKGSSAKVATNYGVYSNETVSEEASMAVNVNAPDVIQYATNEDGSENPNAYENEGVFTVKTHIENITGKTFPKLRILVTTAGCIDALDVWGNPTNSTYDNPYTLEVVDVTGAEQLDLEWDFLATPKESGQYSRIVFKVYDVSDEATLGTGQIMHENLLGEGSSYIMCPGAVDKLPKVKFTGTSPETIFTSGVRNLYVTGENFAMLLDAGAYSVRVNRVDGMKINGEDSFEIPADKIQIDDSTNVMSLILDELNPGNLPEGMYQITLDYTDPAAQDLSGPAMRFTVSDDEKYKNDSYGFIAVLKNTDLAGNIIYEIARFDDEAHYYQQLDLQVYDRTDVLLEFQGNFLLEKTTDGSVRYKGISNNKSHNVMTLNGALDIRNGTCIVTEKDGSVTVDFDADLYTTGAGSYVHTGVAALTELEKGQNFSLIPYDEEGNRKAMEGDPIALLWPAAGQAFQNLMGLLFSLRYGELGTIAHDNAPSIQGSETRLVAFGAAFDLSFLVPSSVDKQLILGKTRSTKEILGSSYDAADHSIRFSPAEVRAMNKQASYRSSTANTSASQGDVQTGNFSDMSVDDTPGYNSAYIVIDDILFGGEYLGIDMDVCLGLPPYIANLPALECLLHVDTIGNWEFGVEGQCHFVSFQVEASLYIRSKDGVPIVDSMRFFIGGIKPGFNIDGVGILWLQGGGGGIENIYDTIFMTDIIPPLKLILEVQFSVMQVFSAIASMGVSLRGADISLRNGQFSEFADPNSGVIISPQPVTMNAGIQIDWYPEFYFQAYVDMLLAMCIQGAGYIIGYEDFYEFFLRAAVRVPGDVPLIGGYEVASMNLGVNLEKVFGKMLFLDMVAIALTYYWGGDIEWNNGESAHPTYPELLGMASNASAMTIPVDYDEETGQTLYMSFGSNLRASAASASYTGIKAAAEINDTIQSDVVTGAHHTMMMERNGSGKILSIQWTGEDEAAAKSQAQAVTIASADGTKQIPIKIWSKDDAENANANFSFDAETNTAYLSVVFAADDETVFGEVWEITTPEGSLLVVFDVAPMPEVTVESSDIQDNVITLELGGYQPETFSSLSVVAEGKTTGQTHLLGTATDPFANDATTLTLTMPEQAMSDTYTLRIVCKDKEGTYYHEEDTEITYVNPNQPDAPTAATAENAGDYKVSVKPTASGEFDGYSFTAIDAEGNVVSGMNNILMHPDGTEVYYDADGVIDEPAENVMAESYLIGGQFEQTAYDEEGNANGTYTTGLKAGEYTIQVRTWKKVANGRAVLLSEPIETKITVREPVNTEIRANAVPATGNSLINTLKAGEESYDVKVVGSSEVILQLTSDAESFTGIWRLDGGFEEKERGEITEATKKANISLSGLEDGSHMLTFLGKNQYGDAVSLNYQFTVDTQGPRMLLGAPVNGSLFDYWTGELTISGVTDADAVLSVTDNTDPDAPKELTVNDFKVDEYGSFTATVTLDRTILSHDLTITLTDALGNGASKDVSVMSNGLGSIEKLMIYAGDTDVTNTKLTAGGTYLLRLMAKLKTPETAAADAEDLIVLINNDGMVDWVQEVMEGSSDLENISEGIQLATSSDAEGMITARFLISDQGAYPVSAAFGYTGEQIRDLDDVYTQITTTDKLYTGKPQTTEIEVWFNGTKLTEGTDFTVSSYTNNVEVTTEETKAEVTVTGIGAFTGTLTGEFEISYLPMEESMVTLSGVEGTNDFYVSDVSVLASEGYELVVEGETADIVFSADGENSETFRIRRISDGAMTDLVTKSANIDKTAPTGTITLDETLWSKFLGTMSFGMYKVNTLAADVTAEDANGIAKTEFVVTDTAYDSVTALAKADLSWKAYSDLAKPTIRENEDQVIYVRITDNAGNVTYLSSDGIHVDTTAPEVSVAVTSASMFTLNFTVTSNEAGEVWYAVKEAAETAPTAEELKNGSSVVISPQQAGTAVTLGVSGLKENTAYVIYAVAEDIVTVLSTGEAAPNTSSVVTSDPIVVTRVYQITVPEGDHYTVEASAETVMEGHSFTFTVQVDEGYDASSATVKVNGVEVKAVDGVYTVSNVDADQIIEVTGVADTAAPELSVKVENNIWTKILETVTFGLFFNETETAEITASDNGSGLYGVYYLISSKPIALDDLANAGWTAYTEALELDADGNYIVYAKAVDNAGNVCYANSTGLVIDTVAPSVDGIEDGGVYTGDVTFTVKDENVDTVTINGVVVEGEVFTVKPADGKRTIEITDKANNKLTLTVTVNPVPEPEPPVCDGKDGCPSLVFPDLDTGAWYHLSTDYVIDNGLMQGYDDGTFQPGEKLSRAMLVQVLYNLEGRPAVSGTDSFADTGEENWYTDAVLWGTQNGIIQGYGNGNFGPNDPVTREQMATIFHRYSTVKGYSLTEGNYDHFTDKDKVSNYAQSAMRWAVGNGLLVGMGDGTLCPKCNTTRAEFATVIQRFIETIAK